MYPARLVTNSFFCVIIGRIREKGATPDDASIRDTQPGIEGQGMHSKNAYGIICVRNSGTVRGALALTF